MAEIEAVLDTMISRELKSASNHVTRATIKMRVLMKILKCLDLSIHSVYDTKHLVPVDISCSEMVERCWFASVSENGSVHNDGSSDEWAAVEKFLAKDFTRVTDLMKLVLILKKRIPDRQLYFLFAVDGLLPTDDHLKMYFDNISFEIQPQQQDDENFRKWHVYAVRKIFETVDIKSPETIAAVLRKILFKESSHLSSSESDDDDDDDETAKQSPLAKQIESVYRHSIKNIDMIHNIARWKKLEMENCKKLIEKRRKRKYSSKELERSVVVTTVSNTEVNEEPSKPDDPPKKIKLTEPSAESKKRKSIHKSKHEKQKHVKSTTKAEESMPIVAETKLPEIMH